MPLLFQYGSNCDTARLNGPGRLNGAAQDRGLAETVDEYEIAFDIWSYTNGCAAGNLIVATGTGNHAWGVLFEVPEDRIYGQRRPDGLRTMEEIEGNRYEPKPIRVRDGNGNEIPGPVTTFLVKPNQHRDGLWTSFEYVDHIVRGLRSHGVPEEYVQRVIDMAIRTNEEAADTVPATEQNRLIGSLRPKSA